MPATETNPRARRSLVGRAATLRELEMRVENCEGDISEIKGDLKTALTEFGKLKDRLNIWGSILIGAMIASGLISGEAGAVLKGAMGVG